MGNAVEVQEKEQKLSQLADSKLGAAEMLAVVDQPSYEVGRELIRGDKELISAVKEYWEPIKTSAHSVHRGICDREKANLTPIIDAVNVIKAKMITFDREEEAKRKAENERLEKEAAAAHQRRMTAAKKYVEGLKEKAGDIQVQINTLKGELEGESRGALTDEEIQVLESEVSVLEMSLKSKADAAALRARQAKEAEEAAAYTPPPAAATPEKTDGVSRKTTYVVEIVDFMTLIKAIANGDVPFNPDKPLFTPSKSALKALATAGTLKPGISHGCRVTKDKDISIR